MNGRCTTDPLDHADDVCEFCAGEFCSNCLITSRNGKSVVCRTCARANSGVKVSHAARPRASKSEVKQARKDLVEAKTTRAPKTFQFFDEAADYVPRVEPAAAVPTVAADDEKPSGRRRGLSLRRSAASVVDEAPEPPPPASEPPETPDNELDRRPAVEEEVEEVRPEPRAPAPTGRLADRLVGSIPAPGPAVTFASPASAQLQHLRATGTPPAESSRSVDDDHRPPMDLDFPVGPAEEAPFTPAEQPFAWAETPQSRAGGDPLTHDPFTLGDPFGSADPAATSVDPFAPTPVPAFPSDEAVGPAPTFDADPAFGSSATFEPSPQPPPMTADSPNPHLEPAASVRVQDDVGVDAPTPGDASADRDANGNWIPPILRGLAPDAGQRAGDLPRRRRDE